MSPRRLPLDDLVVGIHSNIEQHVLAMSEPGRRLLLRAHRTWANLVNDDLGPTPEDRCDFWLVVAREAQQDRDLAMEVGIADRELMLAGAPT